MLRRPVPVTVWASFAHCAPRWPKFDYQPFRKYPAHDTDALFAALDRGPLLGLRHHAGVRVAAHGQPTASAAEKSRPSPPQSGVPIMVASAPAKGWARFASRTVAPCKPPEYSSTPILRWRELFGRVPSAVLFIAAPYQRAAGRVPTISLDHTVSDWRILR